MVLATTLPFRYVLIHAWSIMDAPLFALKIVSKLLFMFFFLLAWCLECHSWLVIHYYLRTFSALLLFMYFCAFRNIFFLTDTDLNFSGDVEHFFVFSPLTPSSLPPLNNSPKEEYQQLFSVVIADTVEEREAANF